MPPEPSDHPLLQIFGLLPEEFDAELTQRGWPRYRGKQLREWVFEKLVTDPSQMTNLSKLDRQRLGETVLFTSAQTVVQQSSSDGTQKLLLGWTGGAEAETVMIPDADRRTACISSQVGCPVGCKFCASGIGGVKGNLSAAQIVEQVFALNRILQPTGERINHIVFMGMGEPLANYANVMGAIRVLHHPQC